MQRFFRTLKTFLNIYYGYMVEYRAELLFWMLSGSLPIILMGVWMEVSQTGDFGLSSVQFARYFFTVFIIRQFTLVWVVWDFEEEVIKGQLSFRLLQPIDPVIHYLTAHIAERFARLPFIILLVILFFILYPQGFWLPTFQQFFLGSIAVIIAFSVRFLFQYTFAMFSFWTEKASAIEQFMFLFYLFLSGYIAPLDVFPPLVSEIAQWTPFPYFLYFPTAIFIGLPFNFPKAILIMLLWGIFFFILNRWLWRKGLKHFSGMGA